MEADWEIEIGPDAPLIVAAWCGYVDLRSRPERISEINEAAGFPALADTLIRLNSPSAPALTAKCDVWSVENVDPDELDADQQNATSALACYIDFIPADAGTFSTLDKVVDWCRRLCLDLRTRPLRQCRLDAIVRRAFMTADMQGFGVTAYVSACGASPEQASAALSHALAVSADSVLALAAANQQASKYNQNIAGE